MDIKLLLRLMAERSASDLFFSTGAPPHIKIDGVSTPMGKAKLPPGAIKQIAYSIMDQKQIQEFEDEWEVNFAYSCEDVGRFRVNVFRQRGEVGMVMRHIKSEIPDFHSLHLPQILADLVTKRSGLILICGPTGSGKSTTLAAMIDALPGCWPVVGPTRVESAADAAAAGHDQVDAELRDAFAEDMRSSDVPLPEASVASAE